MTHVHQRQCPGKSEHDGTPTSDGEFIHPKEWPTNHARRAYAQGFYVEALQVLHGWIETQARGLLMLVGSVHFSAKLNETWNVVEELQYNHVVKTLFALGQITRRDMDELLRINALRNKLIHQYFKDPHEKIHRGISKADLDRLFKKAVRWAEKMTEKNEEIVG